MFALILIVLLGLGMALFAQQNTQTVALTLGPYSFSAVPVYVVVIASMLFGLFVAWILSVMDFFSHSFTLRKKDQAITTAERRVTDLERELAVLREENAALRGEQQVEVQHAHDVHDDPHERKPFFEQVRDRFAHHERKEALS